MWNYNKIRLLIAEKGEEPHAEFLQSLKEFLNALDDPKVSIALRLPHMVSWGGSVVRLADGAGRDHRRAAC